MFRTDRAGLDLASPRRESRRRKTSLFAASVALLLLPLFPTAGWADCCTLIKIDSETPPATIQACVPDAEMSCGQLLFGGTLALGESQQVCSAEPTIIYAEYDDVLEAFGPYVEADCAGDVEI